jgi:dTDP-4-dehydrorhamnose 3,5-epimerase
MLWIPEGFAHGFIALADSNVEYKVTNEYNHGAEMGIIWNAPEIGIDWGATSPLLSARDLLWKNLSDADIKFYYRMEGS